MAKGILIGESLLTASYTDGAEKMVVVSFMKPIQNERNDSFIPEMITIDTFNHYVDVIMGPMASHIASLTNVYSTVYSGADQENIKALRHWPLCGEFTGTGEFPAQRASKAENVPIWWRHHVTNDVGPVSYLW